MMKFCLILILLLCASTFIISDGGIFGSSSSVLSERRLLQAQKPNCPVNFEFQNYTIITSKCKGPRYLPESCCRALKEFMCPYTQYLRGPSNDCASTMLDFINLYGEYPPDLFVRVCRGTMLCLECQRLPPAGSSQSDKAPSNSNTAITVLSAFLPLLLMLPIATLQFIIIM